MAVAAPLGGSGPSLSSSGVLEDVDELVGWVVVVVVVVLAWVSSGWSAS